MQPENKKSHEYDGIYFLPYENKDEGEDGLVISYFDFKNEIDTNPELKELVKIQEGLFDSNDYLNLKNRTNDKSFEALNHYRNQINKVENQELFE